ncbi:MAG: glycosyltransferase [Candidatus Omnitrophica bacterium]|nr:glycosyltransferase [Candidatus Omnitrophota bacterium]
MTTLSLIFPCYNEREGIGHLLQVLSQLQRRLCPDYALELIFVDDGSTDGTAEHLEAELAGSSFTARVIRHERNRGLGAAIRTGFGQARGELIATTDSDCTYDPLALVPMLALLEQGADVVVGSAYHPQGGVHNVPAYRLVLSRGCSWLYRLVLGARIYTYTGLMRLYRAEVVRSVRFESDDFLAVAEILVRALMMGYRVAEHPMTLTVRQYGTSKAVILRIILDHLGFLWWLLRHRVRIRPEIAQPALRALATSETASGVCAGSAGK